MYKDIGLDLGEYQRERSVLLDDIEMRRTNTISPPVPYALDFRKLLCVAQGNYQPVAEPTSHYMLMKRRLQQMGGYVDQDKTILASVALLHHDSFGRAC